MSNVITAYFKGRVGVSEALYQNDYGIVMSFDGIDLPAHFDCYFTVPGSDDAIPGVGADSRVVIPNAVLANSGKVVIHIPLHTGDNDSEVEYIVYFKVIGRSRPVDDGTPTQMTAIEQALALLQNPITNIEQIVNEALAFTGETFEEMQEDLDEWKTDTEEGLETWKGSVESDFDVLQGQFDTAVAAVTTDTEVTDIRVGADGITDTTAGASVRRQFTDLKAEIYYSDGAYETITTTTTDGYYYIADLTTPSKLNYASNQYANTTAVPCVYGDKFKVSFRHMSAVTGIIFANEDKDVYYGSLIPSGTPSAVETDYEVTITDADCKFVIFNGTSGYSTTVKKFVPNTVKAKIASIESKLSSYGNVYTVCPDGSCDFTTIQDAVDETEDGDTILIYPATYQEQIDMTGKVRHLVGVDKATCIITDDSSDYRTPPIMMGAGSVQNLTVIETHANPDASLLNGSDTDGCDFNYQRAYAIHVEDYATCHDANAVTLIENCTLKNTKRCCLGMGMYQGHTIIIRNCDMWTGAPDRTADVNRGVIYFHSRNTDSEDTTNQKIRLINNTGYSDTNLTLFIGDSSRFSGRTSAMECEFINNMFYSSVGGKADSTVGGNTTPSTNVTYADSSYGNNIAKLNV